MKSSLLVQYALSPCLRLCGYRGNLILTPSAFLFSPEAIFRSIFSSTHKRPPSDSAQTEEKKYIKWVDLSVPNEALRQALRLDVDTLHLTAT